MHKSYSQRRRRTGGEERTGGEREGKRGQETKEDGRERGRETCAAFSSSRSSFIRASDTLYNMKPKLRVHPELPHVICVHSNLKEVVGGSRWKEEGWGGREPGGEGRASHLGVIIMRGVVKGLAAKGALVNGCHAPEVQQTRAANTHQHRHTIMHHRLHTINHPAGRGPGARSCSGQGLWRIL